MTSPNSNPKNNNGRNFPSTLNSLNSSSISIFSKDISDDLALSEIKHFDESVSSEEKIDILFTLLQTLVHRSKKPKYRFKKSKEKISPWVINRLGLMTMLWQAVNVFFLSVFEGKKDSEDRSEKEFFYIGFYISIFFQLLLLVLIIAVSIKVIKQTKHRTLSLSLLFNSYFSTTLLFAGIYLLCFRMNRHSFVFTTDLDPHIPSLDVIPDAFLRFVYFSLTTQTSVGYGDITPSIYYTYFIVIIQQIIALLYMTVIFAKGFSHFTDAEQIQSDFDRMKMTRRTEEFQHVDVESGVGDHTLSASLLENYR